MDVAREVGARRFDPAADTAAVRALYDAYAAGLPEDDPDGPAMSPAVFGGWLVAGWTSDPQETWLLPAGTRGAAGGYVLELPDRENPDKARLTVLVTPGRRRGGLGLALLRHAAARARIQDRTVLTGDAREGSPGEAFARSAGAAPGITEVRRVLDVPLPGSGRLDELRCAAQAEAAGYSLLAWEGPAPEEHLDQVAALCGAIGDAPRDAGEQAERWDAARVREADHRIAVQGLRMYTVAARHDSSGALAGLTQVGADPQTPGWGFQELTAVARPHRGHRLGLRVKLAMLDLLASREPEITRIITGNAAANKHMIAINEALGFRVLDRWTSWRITVADAFLR